jgi:ribonuclease PH
MEEKDFGQLRTDLRRPDQLREIEMIPDFAPAAAGSVLLKMGGTHVICGVMIEENVPRWMRQQEVAGGWLTAEYSILPYATTERQNRDSSRGRVGGRTHEIQRMIGRSLRAVVDLKKIGYRTLWVDCDVLQADGGTRTAAVTGAYAALRIAVNRLLEKEVLEQDPLIAAVAAVSVGIVDDRTLLDLCYTEDVAAEVDMNVVMTSDGEFVEVQGTAEERPFSRDRMTEMVDLAEQGIRELFAKQQVAVQAAG